MMREICTKAIQGNEHFAKNDVLFRVGKEANHMFFLSTGSLAYCFWPTGSRRPRAVKVDMGTWCVEITLWIQWQHVGKMKALSVADIISVSSARFRDICENHAQVYPVVQGYALNFLAHENWEGYLTDLGFAHLISVCNDEGPSANAGMTNLEELMHSEDVQAQLVQWDD
eukprot:CAMPEP_0115317350 /NCGR_PEP_ID=MMETSP0270-20121206/78609_1 /TAXON_ID=71861 /ORGANISM="Scrippsiella trochoidea, Strain CCMP3099" /LENGTH=169 /DNA_ID=CAMNT_0002736817 /DNA_START=135 /DNA_END=644 /DNA_ORIENTATION=-